MENFEKSIHLFTLLIFFTHYSIYIKIDENLLSPQYKSLVRTTCNEVHSDNVFKSMCLGKLIPEIEKVFPNSTASFVLLPSDLPLFQLTNHMGSIDLKSYLFINFLPKNIFIFNAPTISDYICSNDLLD